MTKALLVLPSATYRASAYLAAARRLGVEVVTGSDHDQALAGSMGDRFVLLPLEDPDEAARRIVALRGSGSLDAVVAVDDQGSLVAAIASEALGLRHSPPSAIRSTRDKAEMRRRLAAAEVPQPRFRVVEHDLGLDPDEVAGAVARAAASIGYPVVVKPSSLSGSRGVIRADDEAGIREAARRILPIVSDAGETGKIRLLVEAFFPGEEVALEGIVRSGRLEVLAVFDKPDPLDGPYFEETIYVTPSRHDPAVLAEVERVAQAALDALGLDEGPVHVEERIGPARPGRTRRVAVIEVAARTIGGRCSDGLVLADGSRLEDVVLRHALGLDRPAAPTQAEAPEAAEAPEERPGGARGMMMIPIPTSGRLEGVEGVEAALKVPGVTGCEITIAPGRVVRMLPEGDRYLGFLYAAAETPALAEAALRAGHDALTIRIAP